MDLPTSRVLQMYRTMYLIRRFEEAAGQLYRAGMVKGGIHASIGQEGVPVGVCAALEDDDLITSTHRGHGHHIAKGAAPRRLMAEILGKGSGYCQGRGGSMHVAAFDVGSLGAYAIVGAGIPVAVGAALSSTMRGSDQVVVSFFGDGALGQGTLHESLNLAAVWHLPVVFLLENNQYAVSTQVSQSIAISDRAAFAAAYGLPAACVDGSDVTAVYEAAAEAIDRARGGGGASFIECRTYRLEGHYFGEPQVYRSREEVESARQSTDPIPRLEETLLTSHGVYPQRLETLKAEAAEVVEDAVAFAKESADPASSEYGEYVYG